MNITITKDTLYSIGIEKTVYETEEQFLDKIAFYICCLDNGFDHEESQTLCNIYRNKRKYRVTYPNELEEKIQNIISKYKIK